MTKDEKKKIRRLINQELDKQQPDKKRLEELRKMLIDPEKEKREAEEEKNIAIREKFRKRYRSELLFDIQIYIDMRNNKKSRVEIANFLGIELTILEKELRVARARGILKTGDIVTRRHKTYGLTKEVYLKEKSNGLSEENIRKKYHIGSNCFIDLKRSWGIHIRPYKDPYPKERMINFIKSGLTISEIAEEIGISVRSVYNALYRYNIKKTDLIQLRIESKKRKGGIA